MEFGSDLRGSLMVKVVDLPLKETYTLSELLLEASRKFVSQNLRQINFTFFKGLTYTVECTDARTMRLRYCHIEEGKRTVLAYFDATKYDVLMREFEKDIRTCMNRVQNINDTGQVELYLSGQMTPVIFKIRPGGYSYTKQT